MAARRGTACVAGPGAPSSSALQSSTRPYLLLMLMRVQVRHDVASACGPIGLFSSRARARAERVPRAIVRAWQKAPMWTRSRRRMASPMPRPSACASSSAACRRVPRPCCCCARCMPCSTHARAHTRTDRGRLAHVERQQLAHTGRTVPYMAMRGFATRYERRRATCCAALLRGALRCSVVKCVATCCAKCQRAALRCFVLPRGVTCAAPLPARRHRPQRLPEPDRVGRALRLSFQSSTGV
jgi:hypothetical protein